MLKQAEKNKGENLIMETLEKYKNRIYRFMKEEIPEGYIFHTNSGLSRKISDTGSFLTFVGDTVVFLLDHETQRCLEEYQNRLYENCQDMLADRIDSETFHITLHDLSNGNPSEELWQTSMRNHIHTKKILEEFQQMNVGTIQLKPVAVFNMMNTSIVLGLEPANDQSCRTIMEMYDRLQQVVELNYPLTLHVTLAYFRPGDYDIQLVQKLKAVLGKINGEEIPDIEVSIEQLFYQRFDDMNSYYSMK